MQVARRGMQAAGADRAVRAAVDRQAGAACPASWRVWLIAGEREQAAAVVGAEACPGHLVRDREAAGRGARAGSADPDPKAADDAAVDPDAQLLLREVGLEAHPDPAE